MKKRKLPELKSNIEQTEQPTQPFYLRIPKDVLFFSIMSAILFIIIRTLYQVPDYIQDSKSYLLGAIEMAEIGYRPMGYCYFLSKLFVIYPSLVFVAWVQYIIYLFSSLMIIHAFFSIYKFKPFARKILLGVVLLNLPILQLANIMSSDSLFISLTIIWIALCIFIIRKPNFALLAAVLIVLLMCSIVRYNAMIYPIVTILVLLFVRNKAIMISGSMLCILLVWGVYNNVAQKMEVATGTRVFSGFSGWQLASNAMMAYKVIDEKGIETNDEVLSTLDKNVIKYIDSLNSVDPEYAHSFSGDFMWTLEAPFIVAQRNYAISTGEGQFVSWTKISLTLQEYGKVVITQYPGAFIRYYLWPNLTNFFYPELEFLEKYTAPEVRLWRQIRQAYHIPELPENINTHLPRFYNMPFRLVYTLVTLLFIASFLRFLIMFRKWDIDIELRYVLTFLGVYLFCKIGFEVFASPITFRYVLMTTPILTGAVLIMLSINKKRVGNPKNQAEV